ncbi:serine hydrolase domain-containing protein [Nonlabens antarcticus]|uniref:serine hydrolase domain-containing protein n=1 Tax=Nonlabens antarcticus TaxID=392714 RepID=UPI001890F891|nr:serine hydrolase domain-containing protein [Nonlabens antarcticus]
MKAILVFIALLLKVPIAHSQGTEWSSIREDVLKIAQVDKLPTLELTIWNPKDSIYIDYHNPEVQDIKSYGIGSTTKMMVAVFILDLVEQGKINLEDQVSSYIENDDRSLWKNISIRQLLNHTSGLPDYTQNPKWVKLVTIGKTPRSFEERANLISGIKKPANIFNYSNSNYLILEKIVEKVNGQNYAVAFNDFYKNQGLRNIRMLNARDTTQTFFAQDLKSVSDVSDSQEVYGYAGDVHATSEELLKFMKKLFIEKTILNPDQLDLMNTSIEMKPMTIPIGTGIIDHYGLGLMDLTFDNQYYVGHSGGTLKYQSFLFYRPLDQTIVIALTNSSGAFYNNSFVQRLIPAVLDKL